MHTIVCTLDPAAHALIQDNAPTNTDSSDTITIRLGFSISVTGYTSCTLVPR